MSARSRHRRRGGRAHPHGAEVNVTPLIDVVMVLIIFYLMVGSLISSDYADVPLPLSVRGKPAAAADVYVINVHARLPDGSIAPPGAPVSTGAASGGAPAPGMARPAIIVRGEVMDAAELTRDLSSRLTRDPQMVIQLRAARDLPYRAVEPVVRAASRAGATTIRLVTEAAQ